MHVEYEVTMDDYVAFNKYVVETSPTIKRARRLTYLAALAGALWALYLIGASRLWVSIVAVVGALAGFAAWNRFRNPRRIDRLTRRLMAEGRNQLVLTKHHLQVDPDGLTDATAAGEARARWMAVERVVETASHIYLFVGALLAHIIPKRAFAGPEEVSDFIATVNRYRSQHGA